MARLLVREQAWSDLEELGAFIAKDNPAAATEVVRQLRLSFEQLSRMPQLGRISKEDQNNRRVAHVAIARVSQLSDLLPRSAGWHRNRARVTWRARYQAHFRK